MMRRLLREAWGILLLIALWQLWVMTTEYNSIVVVPPMAVLRDILRHSSLYLPPTLWTLRFALAGLTLGMVAGVALAVAGWTFEVFAGMVHPAALLVSSTPVVCLIPLLARIFGYNARTELVTVGLMTFFPAFVYASAGLHNAPPLTREMFSAFGASRSRQLALLSLPAALPEMATALRVGAAYSVLVTLVAEYLMQTGGLGAMLAVTMQQFHLARALGGSAVAMVLSTILYEAAGALETKTALRWSSRQ